jgi:hypothetical protein
MVGRYLEKDEVVHHKDYNYQNNSFENLEVMKKLDHDENHRKDKMGDKNPIHRFPEKNYFKHYKFLGIENGNSKGYTKDQMVEIGISLSKKLGRRIFGEEWIEFCNENGYAYSGHYIKDFKTIVSFFEYCANEAKVEVFKWCYVKEYKKYLEIIKKTDLDIFFKDGIKVRKHCEKCEKEFIVGWNSRERSYCSVDCWNSTQKNDRILREASFNFKVIKIEECGYEDVYNGTVDDNHNYYVYTGEDIGKNEKPRMNFINSRNCGEIPLEAYGVCCLGSLVLPNFVTGSTNTNWKKLEGVIKLAVRFLDNVLDVNKYSLKESDIKAHNSRRIGLGVMGLAEYLFAKEARYGSEKALFEIERLMRFIRDVAYETGVELAEEKGAFPKFDPIQYGNASFVRKLPTELRLKIKEKGIRNVTYLTCPPSGTTSLLPEVSSGIEPLIYRAYKRLDRVSERIYVHPKYKQLLLSGDKVPDWFVDMGNLKASDHFETQKIIQKYIDNAVSKTINLPFGTTYEELDKLLLEYIYDLKGVTVYVEGSKGGQVYTRLSEEETMNYILNSELEIKSDLTEEDKDCGLCEKKEDKK